ncbi:MAG: T9SS type A sorting domain-containing protein [Bacteroidetes bacterium]|nr:T9SS type A sorting domain-containing protein [Bacteroidota bacterium]
MKIILPQLFLLFAVNSAFYTQAQNSRNLIPNAYFKSIKAIPIRSQVIEEPALRLPQLDSKKRDALSMSAQKSQGVTEALIGKTNYDLQTNAAISNRLISFPDGTLSATWNLHSPGTSTSAIGTGYNYFDGTAWSLIPTQRIEPTQRTLFTNIVVTQSGKEAVIAHSSTLPGMLITTRPQKGLGTWTENPLNLGQAINDKWPKAISGGATGETIHVICNGSGTSGIPLYGQDGPLLYSRSLDGGASFPILRMVIPAIDSSHYIGFGGDSYSIDAHGDTVAIVLGSFATDLIFLKSIDNGTTWTSRIIQSFPIPFYKDNLDSLPDLNGDGTSDEIETASGDAHIMLDNNGLAHVFWSNIRVTDTSASALLGYYPNGTDGLYYWNENFATGASPDTIARAEDINGDGVLTIAHGSQGGGTMGLYRGGITQMPSSGVDANNTIYVSYQSLCETCDTTAYGTSYKHVYLKSSADGFDCAIDIDQDIDSMNHECVFACMAKRVDNAAHIIYQRDGAPGHSLIFCGGPGICQGSWNLTESDIIYAKIDLFFGGVNCGVNVHENALLNLILTSYPNPAENTCMITFDLKKNTSANLQLKDVMGKIVYSGNKFKLPPGKHSIVVNTSDLSDGIYFYTLKTEDEEVTKKMLVQHD